MIHSISINKIKDSKFDYLSKGNLLINKTIEFHKGLNIIIGKNGSCKTTLIKMLEQYTFCWKGQTSLSVGFEKDTVKNLYNDNNKFYSGINVKNDYRIKVFKTIQKSDVSEHEKLENFEFFKNEYIKQRQSDGQNQLFSIRNALDKMFSTDVIPDYSNLKQPVNDLWTEYNTGIKNYIKTNQITDDEPIYTLLMDEPDRNLDVDNITQIYNILSNQKENGQMIITLHNPLLIYSLLKMKEINVIELSKGYKNKIINNIETILK